MNIIKTEIDDVIIIEPQIFGDHRGWFFESYSKSKFQSYGIDVDFIQDNHSLSSQKGTIRGLHFQLDPRSQSKLVRCTRGKIYDVAVDLRKGSPTYKQWIKVELSEDNKKQLFIPKGFAHGFITLTDNVEVQYKVDEYYSPENDRSIRFDDPEIGVEWGINAPIISDRDLKAPTLNESDVNFSVRVLVTGFNGQLGCDIIERLKVLGISNRGVDLDDFDITDYKMTEKYIMSYAPDVIVHCAAYTAVDKAEEDREQCYKVNVEGTRNISKIAKKLDAKLLYVSTDYVFDGEGDYPYSEDTVTNPINFYGYTKEQGEKVVKKILDNYFIVRTSWLYGKNGENFIKTMLKLSNTRREVRVVKDQIGVPTYTKDLSILICDMIQTNKFGVYHGVNEGYCSWFEFAKEIFRQSGKEVIVTPILTSEFPTIAKRPKNSRLSKDNLIKKGFSALPSWEIALKRFLKEID